MTEHVDATDELRLAIRPDFESGARPVRTVDLFSGCGGLSLGVAQAARSVDLAFELALAVDNQAAATQVLSSNFPKANAVLTKPIEELLDGQGATITDTEENLRSPLGSVDVLLGGPPCQGHSNLNNHTRRDDPKNALYLYMTRAAQVFSPTAIVIENVPAVLHDKHNGQNVVKLTRDRLGSLGYEVSDAVVSLYDLGVAQKRRRHILFATRGVEVSPDSVLESISSEPTHHDLRWAIGDLVATEPVGFNKPSVASADNSARMAYLLEHDLFDLPNSQRPTCHRDVEHSYKSMYGRLKWTEPAQTITSGYGSIGQGRYMHPDLARALTPHEAARIQGFPDHFSFASIPSRTALATMIGNAVPPQLSRTLLAPLMDVWKREADQADSATS